jgi:hypothetical protein
MDCISTKNFKVNGKTYYIRLGIENGEFVVKDIICATGNGPNAGGIVIPHENVE